MQGEPLAQRLRVGGVRKCDRVFAQSGKGRRFVARVYGVGPGSARVRGARQGGQDALQRAGRDGDGDSAVPVDRGALAGFYGLGNRGAGVVAQGDQADPINCPVTVSSRQHRTLRPGRDPGAPRGAPVPLLAR